MSCKNLSLLLELEDKESGISDYQAPVESGEIISDAEYISRLFLPAFTLPEPTQEQKIVISSLGNIIVSAVAGSGKTTCILQCCQASRFNTLVLTYNARLKQETRSKAAAVGITAEIHSIHAFLYKYYGECRNDAHIIEILKNQVKPNSRFYFKKIIIDEAQDITPLYYRVIKKIISDNCDYANICVFGDPLQTLYKYNGADSRFMNVLCENPKLLNLNHSFRLSCEIARFVKFISGVEINTSKSFLPVEYISCNLFSGSVAINKIQEIINRDGVDNLFILLPSLKTKICKSIMSKLSLMKIDCCTDEQETGKLCFMSIHKVKGLERRNVVLLGFDKQTYKGFKGIEELLYVACTRASHGLVIFQNETNTPFDFITKELENICNVFGNVVFESEKNGDKRFRIMKAEEMYSHLPAAFSDLSGKIEYKISNAQNRLQFSETTTGRIGNEIVSDITEAIIINAWGIKNGFEFYKFLMTKPKLRKGIHKAYKNNISQNERKIINSVTTKSDFVEQIKISIIYRSFITGFSHRLNQIVDYNWISLEQVEKAVCRIPFNTAEISCVQFNSSGFDVIGMGIITNDSVWIIKIDMQKDFAAFAIEALTLEWIISSSDKILLPKALDLSTGQVYEFTPNHLLIESIIAEKNKESDTLSDEEFYKMVKSF